MTGRATVATQSASHRRGVGGAETVADGKTNVWRRVDVMRILTDAWGQCEELPCRSDSADKLNDKASHAVRADVTARKGRPPSTSARWAPITPRFTLHPAATRRQPVPESTGRRSGCRRLFELAGVRVTIVGVLGQAAQHYLF